MKDIKGLSEKLTDLVPQVKKYLPLLFALFLLLVYGFLVSQVHSLNNAMPSQDAINAQSQTAQVPHIDPKLIAQLKSLQDNSVNVKALFDQTRSNPFQECGGKNQPAC